MAILLDYPNQVAVKNWYTSQDNLKAWMYAKGMYKPHYPVPAIPVAIYRGIRVIALWNKAGIDTNCTVLK